MTTTAQEELEWLRERYTDLQQRHAAVGDMLHRYFTAGIPMVSVRQVEALLTGQASVNQFRSALQVLPDPKGQQ